MEQYILTAVILMAVGFVLTIKGGDWFVDAAIWVAEVTNIPKILVGATIVALCTTLPELMVSTFAVASGTPDMGVGNAVGSIICNTSLILGISITFLPSRVSRRTFWIKSAFLLGSIILLAVFALNGVVTWIEGSVLIVLLILYFYVNVRTAMNARQGKEIHESVDTTKKTVTRNLLKFMFGIAFIIVGARLLVDNGVIIAKALGVSDQIIGLTVVALGTSLPELITTISAVIKREFTLSIGNILGANILNILLILSTCSMMAKDGLHIAMQNIPLIKNAVPQVLYLDLPVAFAVSLIVIVPAMITGRFKRWQGIVLLSSYVVYIGYLSLELILA
ncbi:MAG: calcium/sodium antiporter [Clostridia bacterium]|nr:calcium/sodium antiporter [Clostridia bacterium]